MKAWRVQRYGEPHEALHQDDVLEPIPGPGEVSIRVRSSAVGYADVLACLGRYQAQQKLPFVAGLDCLSGEVLVNRSEQPFSRGELVTAWPWLSSGALADVVVCPASRVWAIPSNLTPAQAVAIETSYLTAYLGLRQRANLQRGDIVLVHAGAGALGTAAIHLTLGLGGRVIATASTPAKRQYCKSLGAEIAVSYDEVESVIEEVTQGRGVDIVFDSVGGSVFDASLKALSPGGRFLVLGFSSGMIPSLRLNRLLLRNVSLISVYLGSELRHFPEGVGGLRRELLEFMDVGDVEPCITSRYPFGEVPQALADIRDRKTIGKVLIESSDG